MKGRSGKGEKKIYFIFGLSFSGQLDIKIVPLIFLKLKKFHHGNFSIQK